MTDFTVPIRYVLIGLGAFFFSRKMRSAEEELKPHYWLALLFAVVFSLIKCLLAIIQVPDPFATILVLEVVSLWFAVREKETFLPTSIRMFLSTCICYALYTFSVLITCLLYTSRCV